MIKVSPVFSLELTSPRVEEAQIEWQSRSESNPSRKCKQTKPKRCGNNKKDEDNSPKTLNDKNQQASSQKFRRPNEDEYKNSQADTGN